MEDTFFNKKSFTLMEMSDLASLLLLKRVYCAGAGAAVIGVINFFELFL